MLYEEAVLETLCYVCQNCKANVTESRAIMNAKNEPWSFSVPLGLAAHAQAEQFRGYQSNPRKAKQVYLNSLAVYAVNAYLQFRGFETDLSNSDSWNPLMQTLMDVADLSVKNQGKLECRSVLPGEDVVWVPAEVCSQRIGYVVVQLDQSLRKATVIGFVEKVEAQELPLSQLRSPKTLLERLSLAKRPVKLREWLQNAFDPSWQAVEELLLPPQAELAFSFRSSSPVKARTLEEQRDDVKRVKLIGLGQQQGCEQVALLVRLMPAASPEIDISVEVYPTGDRTYLPQELQLAILDQAGEAVMQAQAKSTKKIQLEFSGEPGERFSIKVALGDLSITEAFVI